MLITLSDPTANALEPPSGTLASNPRWEFSSKPQCFSHKIINFQKNSFVQERFPSNCNVPVMFFFSSSNTRRQITIHERKPVNWTPLNGSHIIWGGGRDGMDYG